MVNIVENDGVFVLNGNTFDLKIDNNRRVYIRKKNDSIFRSLDDEIPVGLSSDVKKKYLYDLYLSIINRLKSSNSKQIPNDDKDKKDVKKEEDKEEEWNDAHQQEIPNQRPQQNQLQQRPQQQPSYQRPFQRPERPRQQIQPQRQIVQKPQPKKRHPYDYRNNRFMTDDYADPDTFVLPPRNR